MKILSVVGARPNFMKVGPIIRAIRTHNSAGTTPFIEHRLVHTGQHYGANMSDGFFRDLDLPRPDVWLDVGSASHATQTAEIMKRFESVLERERPDVVIVVGDVNSTVACALVTAKIRFDTAFGQRPTIVHVEAGLRSFDRAMPEEVNRVLTDHVSDLLFVSEESGVQNLRHEGVAAEKVHFVGNTMIDSLLMFKDAADGLAMLRQVGVAAGQYALLTLHRPSNVDERDALVNILDGLEELAEACPIVFPVHPRTQQRLDEFGINARRSFQQGRVMLTEPLGYLDFVGLMRHARLVVTDSGGIQEETTCLGIPCVTVRDNTERPVTVAHGSNVIAGTETTRIADAVRQQLSHPKAGGTPPLWDGRAGDRIIDVLARYATVSRASVPVSVA